MDAEPAARKSIVTWREIALATLAGMAAGAIYAVLAGQDKNYDQRNYHLYVVYAWLHDRLWFDLAPAQVPNWFNPAGYVPAYLAITHLPPVLAGAAFGAAAGANLGLLYWLSRLLTSDLTPLRSRIVSAVAGLVGMTAASVVTVMGTTFLDAILTLPVLAALLLVCSTAYDPGPASSRGARSRCFAAGVLVGLATGLKLTFALSAVALVLALLLALRPGRDLVVLALLAAAGAGAGYAVAGGYWAYRLWTEYHNPLFPHYNRFFRSPWYPAVNLYDARMIPASLAEALWHPFQYLLLWRRPTAEMHIRDPRFPLVYLLMLASLAVIPLRSVGKAASGATERRPLVFGVLLILGFFAVEYAIWLHQAGIVRPAVIAEILAIALLGVVAYRVLRTPPAAEPPAGFPTRVSRGGFLLAFFVCAYVLWLRQFGIARYIAVLEMLSGIVIWLLLRRIGLPALHAARLFVAMAALIVLTTRSGYVGGRIEYADHWFGVSAPPQVARPDTMHLAMGHRTLGFLVPFLGGGPVLRLEINPYFSRYLANDRSGPWWALIKQRVAAHRGPLRSLVTTLPEDRLQPAPGLDDAQRATLAELGLAIDEQDCAVVWSRMSVFWSCGLRRQAPGA